MVLRIIHLRMHRRADYMHCSSRIASVRRVECLDVVEVVWHSSHFHHPLSVVCVKALYFGSSKRSLSYEDIGKLVDTYLF